MLRYHVINSLPKLHIFKQEVSLENEADDEVNVATKQRERAAIVPFLQCAGTKPPAAQASKTLQNSSTSQNFLLVRKLSCGFMGILCNQAGKAKNILCRLHSIKRTPIIYLFYFNLTIRIIRIDSVMELIFATRKKMSPFFLIS